MNSRIRNYLSVTKKQWNGMVILLIIIAVVLAIPYVYQDLHQDRVISFKDFDKDVALLNQTADKSEEYYKSFERRISLVHGQFASVKAAPGEVIEINSADSAKLTRIRGIGPAFAMRIISYRDRLGGFLNKEQLKEVYGVDTLKYAQIKNGVRIDPSHIKKIKINEVDFEELRKFPYFTNKQTNAVIQYRNQHGNYRSVNDMRNIAILDEGILRKIVPYIVF